MSHASLIVVPEDLFIREKLRADAEALRARLLGEMLEEIEKAAWDVLRIVERDTTEVNALRAALVRLKSGTA